MALNIENFPKILFPHSSLTPNFQKFLAKFFSFIQGIKHPYPAFHPYSKGRYPGGEIVRQGGPKQGIGVVSANLID